MILEYTQEGLSTDFFTTSMDQTYANPILPGAR